MKYRSKSKWISFILAALLVMLFTAGSVFAAEEQVWPDEPELDGEAVVLMEANTSAVIYQKNADEKMYPASTTKILTAMVVLDHCSMDEIVTFTEECCNLEEGAVTIDSVPGEEMMLKDVMYGLLLPSGNDCAMALALHVAGSIEAFADMMNIKAKEIGALSSHFSNPSGLFNSQHYTTATDLAKIAQYAFQNSTFVDIISHPTYIIEPTNMNSESRVLTNTHEMIIPGSPDYNEHVIGGKTGYLYESGRCLVTYAEKEGMTLLAVILDGSYYGIFSETQELLDFAWNNFCISNVSELERRFSYSEEKAKIQLDPTNQIMTLNNVPFDKLSSKINYAYYLNEDEYAAAKQNAGITANDPRQLYATIDYFYADYYLGSCSVFLNPELKIKEVSFISVIYINIWLLILILILIAAAVIFIIKLAKKPDIGNFGPGSSKGIRRLRKTRTYDRSDSVDLGRQYIKYSNRNRNSIHRLDEISVPVEKERYSRSPSKIQQSKSGKSKSRPANHVSKTGRKPYPDQIRPINSPSRERTARKAEHVRTGSSSSKRTSGQRKSQNLHK